jgi:hypothetical protein
MTGPCLYDWDAESCERLRCVAHCHQRGQGTVVLRREETLAEMRALGCLAAHVLVGFEKRVENRSGSEVEQPRTRGESTDVRRPKIEPAPSEVKRKVPGRRASGVEERMEQQRQHENLGNADPATQWPRRLDDASFLANPCWRYALGPGR